MNLKRQARTYFWASMFFMLSSAIGAFNGIAGVLSAALCVSLAVVNLV